MNNLVVQLLLRTGTFSTDLKTARGQVQNFQQGCQTAGKSLSGFGQALGINVGALTKFGGAVGAAVTAGKALKGIIDSTQTSADAFDGAIAGCKGVVDALAVSIASADFSTFQNGLWGVFDAAKAARDALDDLQDAQLGYGMLSSKNRREFAEAQAAYKEAKTADEKEAARIRMENAVQNEEREARNFEAKNFNAIKTQVRARNTNINEKDITPGMIYEVAEIFNSVNSDERRKEAKEAANTVKKEAKKYVTDSKRDQYYQKHQRELIIDVLLEMGDKKIQAVAQELQAGETARTAAATMRRSYIRTTGGSERPSGGRPTTTTKVQKEELEIQDESLTYWKNILVDETKYRDALVKDTEEWKLHNDKVNEAAAKIKEIEGVVEEIEDNDDVEIFSKRRLTEGIAEMTRLRDEAEIGSEQWKNLNDVVEMFSNKLKYMEMQSTLDAALEVNPKTIESLQTVLSVLQQIRNQTDIDSEDFKELSEFIDDIQKKLQSVSGTGITKSTGNDDSFSKITSSVSTLTSGLYTLSDAFVKISGNTENTENEFKKFLDVVQTGVNVFQAMTSIIQTVNSLQDIYTASAEKASAAETGRAAATMSATKTVIAAKKAEAIANGDAAAAAAADAAAQAANSVAGTPIIGPALAIAAAASVIAAIIAAMSKAHTQTQRFANGGIVGGSSFTGDRVSAQVNSGEMILNKTQQANLFKLANGGGTGKEVTFHISGTDLVGVMNNINRKNKVIR